MRGSILLSSAAWQALLAAALFGVSAPLGKLLVGDIDPIILAGLLYIGSGTGATIVSIPHLLPKTREVEASLKQGDLPWLAGAVLFGGVLAPISLMWGLKNTPAATASLLLNFEMVATTLIAFLAFREALGRRIWVAMGLVTLASILLSWNNSGGWEFSLGALAVLGACALWGIDNNLTRHISAKDPLAIVSIKGLSAGTFSLALSFILQRPLPAWDLAIKALGVGAICYGLIVAMFVLALRRLGTARTSTLFGTAPFVGALVSFAVFRENPGWMFFISLPVMLGGACALLSEEHDHGHVHPFLAHEHNHNHTDPHHAHEHPEEIPLTVGSHSHYHKHAFLEHFHAHTPDIHRRHAH